MKILLTAINAKYIHSNLAVHSLKASAGRFGPLVELAEFTINNQTDEIFRAVCRKKPNLLFLSCYIWNREIVAELAENVHRVLPETVIWAGGPEVSYGAEAFLRENPSFSGVMQGEGERTFFLLLRHYVEGTQALEQIPGLAYRVNRSSAGHAEAGDAQSTAGHTETGDVQSTAGHTEAGGAQSTGDGRLICNTGMPEPLRTLDELPFVYPVPEKFENRIIYYESSRGCPYSCSYCLSSVDKKVRFRSTELVKKELGLFLEHRVPQVKFVDRTFNCNHQHALEIWKFLQEHDNGITNFHFEIAADILTEEELAVLSKMRPGLAQLEIGVQTVNEQTLDAICRTAKFERIADRVKRIAEGKNIHQHLDLIAGLPYEDFDSFRHSFDAVYALKPQELQLGFLKVLRGSQIYEKAEQYGIIYRSRPPYEVLATRWISCDELIRLKEVEEMLEIYYNSQQFRHTIEALEPFFASPFALYEALADYCGAQNTEGRACSRLQRFEMLRAFIQEKAPGCAGVAGTDQRQYFDELLTLDLYLRENAKTRPFWAEDIAAHREERNRFYQREEELHSCLPGYEERNRKQMMRMTHLEHFSFDVLGDGKKKETWLLFDYARRDPLTKDAAVCAVL